MLILQIWTTNEIANIRCLKVSNLAWTQLAREYLRDGVDAK